jgi:UDPglucose 6-dehydrogenase
MKVGFIGLGKLGLPCAEEMTRQHEVIGYDKEHRVSPHVKITQDIKMIFEGTDIIFIAVPTPHHPDYDGSKPTTHLENKDFDYSMVIEVLKQCQKYARKNQIVSLISTVLPGTTRRLFAKYTNNFQFVYNPYLIAMGSEAFDMVHPDIVIIGTEHGEESRAAKVISNFYKKLIKNNAQHMTGTWEEAEGFKIFYNTMISARLALVNMIQDVSQKIGNMNVDKITNAFKQANIRITGKGYYKAGMGDGGACHPRDNIALSWLAENLELGYDLFHGISHAREQQTKNMAKFVADICRKENLPLVINGKAYKPSVPYTIGSPSLLLAHYVKQQGVEVFYADNETGDDPELKLGTEPDCVCFLAHDPQTTYHHTGKKYEQKLYFTPKPGSVVIDPWRCFNDNRYRIVYYGCDDKYLGDKTHGKT